MNDIIAMLKCRHALDTKENEIGEELCFCEIYSCWRNITLGECFWNCECETCDNSHLLKEGGVNDR